MFESLDLHDCIRLGRAHVAFWDALQNKIMKHHIACLGQWVGQGIIFVGKKGRQGDYPRSIFFSKDEEIEMSQHERATRTERGSPLNLYHFAKDKYVTVQNGRI